MKKLIIVVLLSTFIGALVAQSIEKIDFKDNEYSDSSIKLVEIGGCEYVVASISALRGSVGGAGAGGGICIIHHVNCKFCNERLKEKFEGAENGNE